MMPPLTIASGLNALFSVKLGRYDTNFLSTITGIMIQREIYDYGISLDPTGQQSISVFILFQHIDPWIEALADHLTIPWVNKPMFITAAKDFVRRQIDQQTTPRLFLPEESAPQPLIVDAK